MPLEAKLIAPFQTGIQTDIKPWLAPEDAFERMENAYIFRGRVRKKFGFDWTGKDEYATRTKVKMGTSTSSGFFTAPIDTLDLKPGHIFKIGEEVFTVPKWQKGATSIPLLISKDATRAVIDFTTNRLSVSASEASKDVYFFPSLPIMGIFEMEVKQLNAKKPIVFDTKHAYTFSESNGWVQFGDKTFNGKQTDFFSGASFFGDSLDETFFYAVNGVTADKFMYIKENGTNVEQFKPHLKLENGTSLGYIHSCKVIKTFANRLFAFNTFEDTDTDSNIINYPYRIRLSPIGIRGSGASNDIWNVTAKLGSGIIEIPTREEIVAAEVLRDKLIVFCEKSTWQISHLASSADNPAITPFSLKLINPDFGASSINSVLSLDDVLVSFSDFGIFQTDGLNVKRIDTKIPDEFLKSDRVNDGTKKIFSLRDVKHQLAYFGFAENSTFANKILCWNYQLDSWSSFDFSFTAFGYSESFTEMTWEKIGKIYPSWADWQGTWASDALQKFKPQILAGNQQGFVFSLNNDKTVHSPELLITNMNPDPKSQEIQIKNHNLKSGNWVEFTNVVFTENDKLGRVIKIDEDTIRIENLKFTQAYVGKGFVARAPQLNLLTKEWTFTVMEGKRFRMPYADFLLSDTANGEITVLTSLNSGSLLPIDKSARLGSNTIKMRKESGIGSFKQDLRWHRLFLQTQQAGIQFQIFVDYDQMEDKNIGLSDFEMHAFLFYISRGGRLTA